MSNEFEGNAIFVTGAASGLGRATALAFAAAGADVCIVDVNESALNAAADQIRAMGRGCLPIVTDISVQPNCAAAIAQAVDSFGRLDTLCNVAGILHFSKLENLTSAIWERLFAVNVHGPLYLIQAAMPHLLKSSGSIVNVASISAIKGHAYLAGYAATKGALVSMTKSLAMEFLKEPVRINAITPGGMNTSMVAGVSFPTDIDMELVARFQQTRPHTEPEEAADLILYLASDRAKSIHGAVISIDAGASAD